MPRNRQQQQQRRSPSPVDVGHPRRSRSRERRNDFPPRGGRNDRTPPRADRSFSPHERGPRGPRGGDPRMNLPRGGGPRMGIPRRDDPRRDMDVSPDERRQFPRGPPNDYTAPRQGPRGGGRGFNDFPPQNDGNRRNDLGRGPQFFDERQQGRGRPRHRSPPRHFQRDRSPPRQGHPPRGRSRSPARGPPMMPPPRGAGRGRGMPFHEQRGRSPPDLRRRRDYHGLPGRRGQFDRHTLPHGFRPRDRERDLSPAPSQPGFSHIGEPSRVPRPTGNSPRGDNNFFRGRGDQFDSRPPPRPRRSDSRSPSPRRADGHRGPPPPNGGQFRRRGLHDDADRFGRPLPDRPAGGYRNRMHQRDQDHVERGEPSIAGDIRARDGSRARPEPFYRDDQGDYARKGSGRQAFPGPGISRTDRPDFDPPRPVSPPRDPSMYVDGPVGSPPSRVDDDLRSRGPGFSQVGRSLAASPPAMSVAPTEYTQVEGLPTSPRASRTSRRPRSLTPPLPVVREVPERDNVRPQPGRDPANDVRIPNVGPSPASAAPGRPAGQSPYSAADMPRRRVSRDDEAPRDGLVYGEADVKNDRPQFLPPSAEERVPSHPPHAPPSAPNNAPSPNGRVSRTAQPVHRVVAHDDAPGMRVDQANVVNRAGVSSPMNSAAARGVGGSSPPAAAKGEDDDFVSLPNDGTMVGLVAGALAGLDSGKLENDDLVLELLGEISKVGSEGARAGGRRYS